MLQGIIVFIIFLGPLVFFHELGHYLFARWAGVRVEVFSIGFGPKLFKFNKWDTEFTISAIPLGGYVKMFGDDPFNKDKIPEEERKYSFIHKGKWDRFLIVFGGPLANFIFAFAIFFSLLMVGEKMPEMRLGALEKDSVFYSKGLRSGDVLKKVNGQSIYNISDLAMQKGGEVHSLTVVRDEREKVVNIGMSNKDFFEEFKKNPPLLRRPIVVDKRGKQYIVSNTRWKPSQREKPLDLLQGGDVFLTAVSSTGEAIGSSMTVNVPGDTPMDVIVGLAKVGFFSLDLAVKKVKPDSPADRAGIKPGDVMFSLQGKEIYSFNDFKSIIKTHKGKLELKAWRLGEVKTFSLRPQIKDVNGQKEKLVGVWSSVEYSQPRLVSLASKGLIGSITIGFQRTIDTIGKIMTGFVQLVTGEVSLKNLGGPIAIGKVANDSLETSLSYFFQLMALLSVNLGIINLFPIPVLDGGHILFICLEVINRKPLSEKTMIFAQSAGMIFLLFLMVSAIFNDLMRVFN